MLTQNLFKTNKWNEMHVLWFCLVFKVVVLLSLPWSCNVCLAKTLLECDTRTQLVIIENFQITVIQMFYLQLLYIFSRTIGYC